MRRSSPVIAILDTEFPFQRLGSLIFAVPAFTFASTMQKLRFLSRADPLRSLPHIQFLFDAMADRIAGSPNATNCAIRASTQMSHGIVS